MALAAISSLSTTIDVIPPPIAVASALSCDESIGAHNSAMVPIIPVNSPLSRAEITAAAPPAIPLAPEEFSISARNLSLERSASRSLRSIN